MLLCNLMFGFLALVLGTGKASAVSGTEQLAVSYVQDQEIERGLQSDSEIHGR
jgi:hypothetical protein